MLARGVEGAQAVHKAAQGGIGQGAETRGEDAGQGQQAVGGAAAGGEGGQHGQGGGEAADHPRRKQDGGGAVGEAGGVKEAGGEQDRCGDGGDGEQGEAIIKAFYAQGGNGGGGADGLFALGQVEGAHQLAESEGEDVVRQIADIDDDEQASHRHGRHGGEEVAPAAGAYPLADEVEGDGGRQVEVVGGLQGGAEVAAVDGYQQQGEEGGADGDAGPEAPVAEEVVHHWLVGVLGVVLGRGGILPVIPAQAGIWRFCCRWRRNGTNRRWRCFGRGLSTRSEWFGRCGRRSP